MRLESGAHLDKTIDGACVCVMQYLPITKQTAIVTKQSDLANTKIFEIYDLHNFIRVIMFKKMTITVKLFMFR